MEITDKIPSGSVFTPTVDGVKPVVATATVILAAYVAVYHFGTQLATVVPSAVLKAAAPFLLPQSWALGIAVTAFALAYLYVADVKRAQKQRSENEKLLTTAELNELFQQNSNKLNYLFENFALDYFKVDRTLDYVPVDSVVNESTVPIPAGRKTYFNKAVEVHYGGKYSGFPYPYIDFIYPQRHFLLKTLELVYLVEIADASASDNKRAG